jgi:hypothetical protein
VRLAVLVLIAWPALALAKPKVAVAPIDGDDDGKVAAAVAEAAKSDAKIVGPDKVSGAMESLGVTTTTTRGLKKLRIKLEADVIIHGTLERDGSKKHLVLTLSGRAHGPSLELDYKTQKTLKKELAAKLPKRIDEAMGGDEEPDPDDDPKPVHKDRDDPPAKKDRDDPPARKDQDDSPPRRKVAETEHVRKRAHDESEEDDDHPKRKRRHRRNALSAAAIAFDAGGAFARRTLTYDGGAMRPPNVGTADPGVRIAGEVYPFSMDGLDSPAAGLGLYGEYGRTFGLSIDVPGTSVSAPITDAHYSVGARYRFVFGQTTLAVGAAYWRRYYTADRSGLTLATQLDMPDVSYTAVAPGVLARIALSPTIGGFASLDLPLVLDAGPIVSSTNYGSASVLGFDFAAGVQFAVAPHYAVAGESFNDVEMHLLILVKRSMGIVGRSPSVLDASLGPGDAA